MKNKLESIASIRSLTRRIAASKIITVVGGMVSLLTMNKSNVTGSMLPSHRNRLQTKPEQSVKKQNHQNCNQDNGSHRGLLQAYNMLVKILLVKQASFTKFLGERHQGINARQMKAKRLIKEGVSWNTIIN